MHVEQQVHDTAPDSLLRVGQGTGLLERLEIELASELCDRAEVTDPVLRLAFALALRAPRVGDMCFDPQAFSADKAIELARFLRREAALASSAAGTVKAAELRAPRDADLDLVAAGRALAGAFADNATLAERLIATGLVVRSVERVVALGPPDPFAVAHRKPFVLSAIGGHLRLYTDRYFTYETRLAQHITRRLAARESPAPEIPVHAIFRCLFPEISELVPFRSEAFPLAALAAATAMTLPLTVVTGGPGTGKTFAVRNLLLLNRVVTSFQLPTSAPRVALAAPTGKAAARLRESLIEGLDATVSRFHGALVSAKVELPTTLDSEVLRATIADLVPVTLHALLGINPSSPTRPRYGSSAPLPYDLVVVDEASMIDLPLMARLFDALDDGTRLVLLGDHRQLASVEAGSVLTEVTRAASVPVRPRVPALEPFFGPEFSASVDAAGLEQRPTGDAVVLLADIMVSLQRSRRFDDTTTIGRFAKASIVEPPDVQRAMGLVAWDVDTDHEAFRRLTPPERLGQLPPAPGALPDLDAYPHSPQPDLTTLAFAYSLDAAILAGTLPWLIALHRGVGEDAARLMPVLDAFDAFRILAGHRSGALGVEALNRRVTDLMAGLDGVNHPHASLIDGYLQGAAAPGAVLRAIAHAARGGQDAGHGPSEPFWPGRPVLVTRNDNNLGLRNGDVGIVVAGAGGQGALVAFRGPEQAPLRLVPAAALPRHETSFAMTIHKSQGSEYRHVMVVLPERASPIVTRELIYTAVTRMRRDVTLVATDLVLRRALATSVTRASGLYDSLQG